MNRRELTSPHVCISTHFITPNCSDIFVNKSMEVGIEHTYAYVMIMQFPDKVIKIHLMSVGNLPQRVHVPHIPHRTALWRSYARMYYLCHPSGDYMWKYRVQVARRSAFIIRCPYQHKQTFCLPRRRPAPSFLDQVVTARVQYYSSTFYVEIPSPSNALFLAQVHPNYRVSR
jgi:hypothetical protein